MTILALFLCSLIGLSLGLLGGGGSILAVPVLVYVALVPAHAAVGMSLAVVGVTSLFAALLHLRAGNLNVRLSLLFGLSGVGGAFLGARLSRGVRPGLLLALFGAVMIAAGVSMLRRRAAAAGPAGAVPVKAAPLVPVGLGLGLMTGFLGVGGGFLVVPALVVFGGLPMRQAVGTSLAIIAINSGAGFLGALGEGALDLPLTAAFGGMALAGALAGQRLAGRVSQDALRKAFGILVLALGALLLSKNLLSPG